MSRTPNLILIGASKCSTTTLYELLKHHPDVWLPRDKGVYHFSSPQCEDAGSWEAYRKRFRAARQEVPIVGESSNSYTQQPEGGAVAQRIRRQLGSPRLIYVIRDPVQRAVSHFRHKCLDGGGAYAGSMAEALDSDPLLASVSRYAMQLDPFHEQFGLDGVMVVVAERLHLDPVGVMRRVERYLGIRSFEWGREHLPRSNCFEQLKQTTGWRKLLGAPLHRRLRRLTPAPLRRVLKPLGPRLPDPPVPTDADLTRLFSMIADDLRRVVAMLGDEVSLWPSLRRFESDR